MASPTIVVLQIVAVNALEDKHLHKYIWIIKFI